MASIGRAMKFYGGKSGDESIAPRERWYHLARLAILAVTLTGVLVALAVLPRWLLVVTPRWLYRGAVIAFLWTSLAVYLAAFPTILIGGMLSFRGAARGYRRRDRGLLKRSARWMLLASSGLLGLVTMELGSASRLRFLARLPVLPTRFAQPAIRVSTTSDQGNLGEHGQASRTSSSVSADDLYIVVVGESSAIGVPYQPWLSVGQLVGWQLEQVFPGRTIRVEVRAEGGICLEAASLLLRNLERRPDAMIVFAGHNEFQARFGWSRNVSHYVEEGASSPLAMVDRVRSLSAACKLILTTMDLYYGEAAPDPRITRELVDHPVCSSSEHAFLRDDFQLRLDALAEYCTRIGCLPILIMPGSNDGSFEPSRSVLAGSVPAEQRAAFAREFKTVRAGESVDAGASIGAYRRLAEQHPEFAETHFRLGRLLAGIGSWDDAREHFVLARELDGLPLRCPTGFREAYRVVARRHGAVLVDGPDVLARISPHGILDDYLYHDAHHVNLVGMVALANDMLAQLRKRRSFGWPEMAPAPPIVPEACARHFELDSQKWAEVCSRSASFYDRTAYIRFDPSARLRVRDQYHQAALNFAAGRPAGDAQLPGVAMANSLLHATPTLPKALAKGIPSGR
jgi:hypothetical protein